jgi:hypothetical protein
MDRYQFLSQIEKGVVSRVVLITAAPVARTCLSAPALLG